MIDRILTLRVIKRQILVCLQNTIQYSRYRRDQLIVPMHYILKSLFAQHIDAYRRRALNSHLVFVFHQERVLTQHSTSFQPFYGKLNTIVEYSVHLCCPLTYNKQALWDVTCVENSTAWFEPLHFHVVCKCTYGGLTGVVQVWHSFLQDWDEEQAHRVFILQHMLE